MNFDTEACFFGKDNSNTPFSYLALIPRTSTVDTSKLRHIKPEYLSRRI